MTIISRAMRTKSNWLFAGLALFAAGCMTTQQASQMGSQEHPKILKSYGGTYTEKGVGAYVSQIGGSLASKTNMAGSPFRFTLLNSPVVNAFALPGGYVYVTRGILALANSEAELAGVIGHEIGHVTANHSAQRYNRSVLAGIGGLAVGILTGSEEWTRLAQTGGQLYVMNYSRDQEYESDELGVKYMKRANYDPYAMGDFLSEMAAQQTLHAQITGKTYDANRVEFFSSHPNTADRTQRAYRLAKGQENMQRGQLPIRRNAYLEAIDGMLYGDDPAQGYVRGRRFSHPVQRFTFEVPHGYSMQNQSTAVVAMGPNNTAVKFDAAPDYRANSSLQGYVSDTWARSLNVKLVSIKSETVNGIPMAKGVALVNTSSGAVIVQLVAYQFSGNQVYRMMNVTSSRVTTNEKSAYEVMFKSFRRLSASEAAKLKPLRLRVVKVQRGDNVFKLSKRMAFDSHREARFRALNGLGPNEGLKAGQLVKIVVEG